ncbi:transposase [Acidovorax sp. FJL06]|uniref:transposase n=1 Tax=Acidovorax sp. FJL06 TaxID=2153365 RepID=UPI000F56F887|nr:transposase [Acidovorax sp. FJL06]
MNHHSLHDFYGLSPKRSTYSAQLKLQVLAHQNREQRSSRQIATLYDIRNPNQIVVWLNPDQGGLQERESGNEEQPKIKPKRRSDAPSSPPPHAIAIDPARETA